MKILKSLFVLLAVGVVTVFATNAFFSDTEVSKGNRFVAGAIDLTVDSEGHYNGYECVGEKWQKCVYTGYGENFMDNGSFETPDVDANGGWELFENGTPGLMWTVEWESSETTYNSATRPNPALVEYHEGVKPGWNAYDGEQYAELDTDWDGPGGPLNNEPARVRIYQNVPTEFGKRYEVSYAYSPRPDVTNAADNELIVRLNGSQIDSHSAAGNNSSTSWTVYKYEFDGTGNPAKIEFAAGGTANSLGVFLDEVVVREMTRECTIAEDYTNQVCYSTWSPQNLTNGDEAPFTKFFNFSDLKPGDYGENTISLHVENNDAHACMYFDNYLDQDVTLTEPEIEDEDEPDKDPENPGVGELGNNVYFFAWRDDGDNVYEDGETPITQGPVVASTFLNGGPEYLGVMPATETDFLGLAWCFGYMSVNGYTISCDGSRMSQNEAQTDSLSTDIGFYVEQARHNSSEEQYACPSLPREVTPN